MQTKTIQDGTDSFVVSFHEAAKKSPVMLFAVGAGGQPERYATLLTVLIDFGCTVIAPHFERLASSFPSETDLTLRARRLSIALDTFAQPGVSVAGVGHSIGAATLLALSGAQMWLGVDRRVNIASDGRLSKLALLAPPTGFFQAPGALNEVRVPILAWVGSEDAITPPAQTEWLANAIHGTQVVDVRVTTGAGHFSYMDLPPPQTIEPMLYKQVFLQEYSREVFHFLAG